MAHQGMGFPRPLQGLMVVANAVHENGMQIPALRQPGPRFDMGQAEGRLFLAQAFMLAGAVPEDGQVAIRRGRQQGQLSDIVQEAGQIGLIGIAIAQFHG